MTGRSPSTISREINRNRSFMNIKPAYYPHTAQKKYLLRRSYCHRGMFQSEDVIKYIEEKLLATWSPEQIACTPAPIPMPSWRTIYRWLYDKYLLNGNLKVLNEKEFDQIAQQKASAKPAAPAQEKVENGTMGKE